MEKKKQESETIREEKPKVSQETYEEISDDEEKDFWDDEDIWYEIEGVE